VKLKKLTLTNFRNYEKFEINFNEKLNVIVAENGAGKTTILDAIAIGYGAMLTRFPKIKGKTFEKSDLRIDFDNKAVPYMRVKLESYTKAIKKNKNITSTSLFGEDDEDNITWDRTQLRNQSQSTKILTPKAKGLKELYDYVDSIVDKEYEQDIADYEIPLIMYYGTSRAVFKDSIRKEHFKQEFSRYGALNIALKSDTNFTRYFQWFSAMENEENRQIKEQEDLNYKLPALEAVRKSLEIMLPQITNPRIKIDPFRFVVDKLTDNKKVEFRINQLSDGYKTVLAMVMDISARMAEANPHLANSNESEALIMIDEIDLHLHPRWQQTILVDLQKAFPTAQFIVTTHSPQVLTSVENKSIQIISDSQLNSAPLGTEGAEASRVLKRVFGVELRPKENSITIKLNKYLDLVYDDKWDEKNVLEERKELDTLFNGEEPALMEADLYIENRKWELEIEEDS